jgi:uncharacterized protein (TIGR02145 family)
MYLENKLGMSTALQGSTTGFRSTTGEGSKLSTATSSGNNNSGFTALLAGGRGSNGPFNSRVISGFWWSSSEASATLAQYRALISIEAGVYRNGNGKASGLSVRCLKD